MYTKHSAHNHNEAVNSNAGDKKASDSGTVRESYVTSLLTGKRKGLNMINSSGSGCMIYLEWCASVHHRSNAHVVVCTVPR
jgi:hypothetical protein